MILKILPLFLLVFSSCSSTSVPIVGKTKLVTNKASTDNTCLYGAYNFRDTFDFSNSIFSTHGTHSLVFDDTEISNIVSLSVGSSSQIWSCYKVDFEWVNNGPSIEMTFYCHNVYATTFYQVIPFGASLSQVGSVHGGYNDIILNFNNPLYVNGISAGLFNTMFTKDNNYLTTSYNGYYNFNNNLSSIGADVTVFGPISFDNKLFKMFTDKNNGALGGYTNLLFLGYSIEQNDYIYNSYSLPFDNNTVLSPNILMNGVKMTITSYNNLSNVGIFSYVRDSSLDDTDFEDLLFTIADTPVYFVSQFLSFELFGFNLFVALCGLATIALVVLVIKKVV